MRKLFGSLIDFGYPLIIVWGISVFVIPFGLGGLVLIALFSAPVATWFQMISFYDVLTNVVFWYAVLMALTGIGTGMPRKGGKRSRAEIVVFILGFITLALLLVGKFLVHA